MTKEISLLSRSLSLYIFMDNTKMKIFKPYL